MSTPLLRTYVRGQSERREIQMQTSFPAKVLGWNSSTNTVRLEPQFTETWVRADGETQYEDAPDGDSYIDNVPVLFPRSGSWSITFPIETGSFGLVICTKYSLDAFRNQGHRVDPGDLRRFTMSGATFHPVNLHPNASHLVPSDSDHMVLGSGAFVDFIALAAKVDGLFEAFLNATPGAADGGAALQTAVQTYWTTSLGDDGTGSTTVKASL